MKIARVAQRRGQSQQLLQTQVILILNFTRIHWDYLLITQREKLLNFWMPKTATVVGRGHRSRTLLNLRASFFHSHTFWKRSFTTPCYSWCFHFRSCLVILRCIPRQFRAAIVAEKQLLDEWAVARQPKDLFLPLLTREHSVILPSMLIVFSKKAPEEEVWCNHFYFNLRVFQ